MSNVTPTRDSGTEELLLHSDEGVGPNEQLEVVLQPAQDDEHIA